MNKSCFVCCAQGLGDWIIVNPTIRILSRRYETVRVIYNDYSKSFVPIMFADLSNIVLDYELIGGLPCATTTKQYAQQNSFDFINLMTPGSFVNGGFVVDVENITAPFNRLIYKQAGFDWDTDHHEFYIPINMEESIQHHKSLNLPDKYVFLHEGGHGTINRSHILDKTIPVFVPHKIPNPFLYKYTIIHAAEIHVMDSSFYNFADKLNLTTKNIFLHKLRNKCYSTPFLSPKLNKPWKFVDY